MKKSGVGRVLLTLLLVGYLAYVVYDIVNGSPEQIGKRETIMAAGFTFNIKTLEMTWTAMAVTLLIAIVGTQSLKVVPTGWQNVLEMVVTGLHGQMDATMGTKGRNMLAPFIITLFLFLLVSNLLGLVPGMASPTNDLNTTMGLALLVICLMHGLGLYLKGFKYIKHFFEPFPVFIIINIIEEIAKPITLAFRLFGNILAGEILIIILLQIATWFIVPSVCWLAFSIFISCIQAFIFTMLSIAYLANAVKEDEPEVQDQQ
jgi:F-type H+-transporting ATPase subunit a